MLINGYKHGYQGPDVSMSTDLSVHSSSISVDQKSSPIRQHPIFKQVDEELKKLREQFDTIRTDQPKQQTQVSQSKNKSMSNFQLSKPTTAVECSPSRNPLNFSLAPKVNQSFGNGNWPKPSSGINLSGERGPTKYFRQANPNQAKVFSVKKSAFLEQRDITSNQVNSVYKEPYGREKLEISDVMSEKSQDMNRSLYLKEMELDRKQKELEYREQKDKEHKERETSIRKNEQKKYADQEEKNMLLTKKLEGVNKENSQLKFEITKLKAEVKQCEVYRKEIEQLRKALFDKQFTIQQLQHKNQQALEVIAKKEQIIKSMEAQTGAVKQIVLKNQTEDAFNLAIKTSLEENIRIKEIASAKDDEIEHVREQNRALRAQVDTLRNEIEINKLKYMADVKNVETNYDIDKQAQTNELASLRKTVAVLDEKFKFILKEDKRKDEFMVNFFKGKIHDPNDKQLIVNFFKLYEDVPKLTISELLKQQHAIQNQLKQQINRLKERIDVDEIIHKQLRKQMDDLRKNRYI